MSQMYRYRTSNDMVEHLGNNATEKNLEIVKNIIRFSWMGYINIIRKFSKTRMTESAWSIQCNSGKICITDELSDIMNYIVGNNDWFAASSSRPWWLPLLSEAHTREWRRNAGLGAVGTLTTTQTMIHTAQPSAATVSSDPDFSKQIF